MEEMQKASGMLGGFRSRLKGRAASSEQYGQYEPASMCWSTRPPVTHLAAAETSHRLP